MYNDGPMDSNSEFRSGSLWSFTGRGNFSEFFWELAFEIVLKVLMKKNG